MQNSHQENVLKAKYKAINNHLDEKSRRLWAAAEAKSIGWGGITKVAKATGISHKTIRAGLINISSKNLSANKIRKAGGGRKKITEKIPALLEALEALIEPLTRGDPETPLRWVCKSTRNLAEELTKQGKKVTQRTVYTLLSDLGYSLQSNKKTDEGNQHPDRNAQFKFINREVKKFQKNHQPVISVDTKKKELLGNFKNVGQEWRMKKDPTKVKCHDFPEPGMDKAAPYGVYDITNNMGWVNVGISSDTAEFAVASIRKWWEKMGCEVYEKINKILITADCGGSNSYRARLWKFELQKLSNELNIDIQVSHFPPGTSKWNKIEHKLFSFITKNWRGKPLIDRATIVNLIGNTKTKTGLVVQAELDKNIYAKGVKISEEEFKKINISSNKFHGEWNYVIKPNKKSNLKN
jgi:transposase